MFEGLDGKSFYSGTVCTSTQAVASSRGCTIADVIEAWKKIKALADDDVLSKAMEMKSPLMVTGDDTPEALVERIKDEIGPKLTVHRSHLLKGKLYFVEGYAAPFDFIVPFDSIVPPLPEWSSFRLIPKRKYRSKFRRGVLHRHRLRKGVR